MSMEGEGLIIHAMWDRLFKGKKPPVSGISIILLHRPLERYSTERLNSAMERAWRQKYDEQEFFALSIFEGGGAVLKVAGTFISILHYDQWVGSKELGDMEIPEWALHTGHSIVEYKCPGGVPEGEVRQTMYGFMGLLCAELLTPQTVAILFADEHVLVQNAPEISKRLRSGQPLNPLALLRDVKRSA